MHCCLPLKVTKLINAFNKYLPEKENFVPLALGKKGDASFEEVFRIAEASRSDYIKIMKAEKDKLLLPKPLETFEDMSSDKGIEHMAFYGVGQIMLKKSAEAAPAAYEVKEEYSFTKATC